MSRFWKWALGILGALIVVGLIVGAVFMWRNYGFASGSRVMMYSAPDWRGSPQRPYMHHMPYGDDGLWGPSAGERGWDMPMMRGRGLYPYFGSGPFGFGFMLLGGLIHLAIPLGVLALVAYLFYQMGRRAGAASSGSLPNVDALPRRRVARR